jgi:hypothetical protein
MKRTFKYSLVSDLHVDYQQKDLTEYELNPRGYPGENPDWEPLTVTLSY